jgi:CheY-like chemotaxis protein
VLLVDDDPAMRALLSSAFEGAGYDVRTADNGRRALSLARAMVPDLVVTDIVMPEMEGIATIMALKRLRPRPRMIAISGQTAVRANNYLTWASALGADAVLPKPFRMTGLVKLAEEVLSGEDQALRKTGG